MTMGLTLLREVLDSYHGPPRRKLLLASWAIHADDITRVGWCPREVLAEETGVTPRQVTRMVAELISEHALARTRMARPGRAAVYTLGSLTGQTVDIQRSIVAAANGRPYTRHGGHPGVHRNGGHPDVPQRWTSRRPPRS